MPIQRILLFVIFLLTACAPASGSLDQGIEGIVTVGPMCPVMQEDTPCPDQPYPATLTVLTTNGKEVIQFETDEGGRFRVGLAPGAYVLHPESPNMLPFAADVPFTVDEGQFTQLEIHYDSGIR